MLRRILFWSHLGAGLLAGLVILIMSVTGVLLAYEKQITAWFERGDFVGMLPPAGGSSLSLEALLESARKLNAADTGMPNSVTFYPESRVVAISTAGGSGPGNVIYVDRYSGSVLGVGSAGIREFFRTVTNWHRTIAAPQDRRDVGRAITGAANLVFLVIVASGLCLWWSAGKRSLRQVIWFRRGLKGKARDWNWHNALGFWLAIPLFFITLSGVVISYPWATTLVYRITGNEPPDDRGRGGERGRRQEKENVRLVQSKVAGNVDQLIAQVDRVSPNWNTISLRLPAGAQPVQLTIDRGNNGQPQYRSTLTLDSQTGSVVREERFADQNAGRRVRSWLRFVHTGEYYGAPGQAIAAVASGAAVVLVWTGGAMAWRRLFSWLRGRGDRRATAAAGNHAA